VRRSRQFAGNGGAPLRGGANALRVAVLPHIRPNPTGRYAFGRLCSRPSTLPPPFFSVSHLQSAKLGYKSPVGEGEGVSTPLLKDAPPANSTHTLRAFTGGACHNPKFPPSVGERGSGKAKSYRSRGSGAAACPQEAERGKPPPRACNRSIVEQRPAFPAQRVSPKRGVVLLSLSERPLHPCAVPCFFARFLPKTA
jgi:hypothetical protein